MWTWICEEEVGSSKNLLNTGHPTSILWSFLTPSLINPVSHYGGCSSSLISDQRREERSQREHEQGYTRPDFTEIRPTLSEICCDGMLQLIRLLCCDVLSTHYWRVLDFVFWLIIWLKIVLPTIILGLIWAVHMWANTNSKPSKVTTELIKPTDSCAVIWSKVSDGRTSQYPGVLCLN